MLNQDHRRLAFCLPEALQGAKGGRRDSFKRLDKQASHQSLNGIAEENAASSASLQTSTGERKDLLARLQGPEQTRGDLDQLLAAAAKVLQDAGMLCTTAVSPFATCGLERRYIVQLAAMQLQLKTSLLHEQHGRHACCLWVPLLLTQAYTYLWVINDTNPFNQLTQLYKSKVVFCTVATKVEIVLQRLWRPSWQRQGAETLSCRVRLRS